MRPTRWGSRLILIRKNRRHPPPQSHHTWPQAQCRLKPLPIRNFTDSHPLSLCPSSLYPPRTPPPRGLPTTEAGLHRFRTIFSLLMTLRSNLLIYLHRAKCTPHPNSPWCRPITPILPQRHNLVILRTKPLLLFRILPVLNGLIQMRHSIIIPISKCRATSLRALLHKTRGSTNHRRTRATIKWERAWTTLSPGLTRLALTICQTLGLGLTLPLSRFRTPRSLVLSQCSLMTMM